jgi:hypothetical protein
VAKHVKTVFGGKKTTSKTVQKHKLNNNKVIAKTRAIDVLFLWSQTHSTKKQKRAINNNMAKLVQKMQNKNTSSENEQNNQKQNRKQVYKTI